jgi:hypothetical protein
LLYFFYELDFRKSMKKNRNKNIFLYVVGALCFGAVKSYAVKKTTAKFKGEDRSFWEKNNKNMKETISYDQFLLIKKEIEERYGAKGRESPFVLYSIGNRQFEELPASADGSCLWDRLGIPPQKMFNDIIRPVVNEVSEKCTVGKKEDCTIKMIEITDILDPLERISRSNEKIEDRFEKNLKYDKTVKENWLEGVEEHGGKEIDHNGSKVAFRPPNGDEFFQKIAENLKVNIIIFSHDSSKIEPTLELAREFNVGSNYNLYLLDPRMTGLHYSPLIEVGEPVAKAIIEEMNSYLEMNIFKPEQEKSPELDPKKRKEIKKINRRKK